MNNSIAPRDPHQLSRLLWIDDEAETVQWASDVLGKNGFAVDGAVSGPEGLMLGCSGKHDAAVLAWRLPYLPGEWVIRGFRAAGVAMPAIVISSDPQVESAARLAGANDFLVKPLRADLLLARIVAWVTRSPPLAAGILDKARTAVAESAYRARRLERWHRRLLAGDRGGEEELVEESLPLLLAYLQRRAPRADMDLIATAAADAIIVLTSKPAGYDPFRMSLDGFLRLSAKRKLWNALRGHRRRLIREHIAADQVMDRVVEFEARRSRWRDLRFMFRRCETKTERLFLHAWLRGEPHGALATVLGVTDLSMADQRAEIHRAKARLRQRIRRALVSVRRTNLSS